MRNSKNATFLTSLFETSSIGAQELCAASTFLNLPSNLNVFSVPQTPVSLNPNIQTQFLQVQRLSDPHRLNKVFSVQNSHKNHKPPKQSVLNDQEKKIYSLECFYTNPTSIMNKFDELKTRLAPPHRPNLIFICETWFKPDSPLNIDGYTLYHLSRESAKGGVAIFAKNNLITYEVPIKDIDTTGSEQIWCGITIGKERILSGCVYRPPSANEKINKIIVTQSREQNHLLTKENLLGFSLLETSIVIFPGLLQAAVQARMKTTYFLTWLIRIYSLNSFLNLQSVIINWT